MNYPPTILSKTQRSLGSRVCQKCLIYGSLWMFFGLTANAQVLPKEKSISDKKGRTIEGVILGIEADQLVFKKTNDDKELKIPRSSISEEDQKYLRDLEKFISEDVGLEFITIGNPGNENDPKTGTQSDPKSGETFGKVDYIYEIGKQAITVEQYVKFLNAKAKDDPYGLYDVRMTVNNASWLDPNNLPKYGIIRSGDKGSYTYSILEGYAQKPVAWIDWHRAARFCNWVSNGQGNGDTETGSYTLGGKSTGIVPLNKDALVRLPTENEWYKAVFYNPTTSTYSSFPGGDMPPKTEEASSHYGCIYRGGTERIDGIFKSANKEYRPSRSGFRGSNMRFSESSGAVCDASGDGNMFRIVRGKISNSHP